MSTDGAGSLEGVEFAPSPFEPDVSNLASFCSYCGSKAPLGIRRIGDERVAWMAVPAVAERIGLTPGHNLCGTCVPVVFGAIHDALTCAGEFADRDDTHIRPPAAGLGVPGGSVTGDSMRGDALLGGVLRAAASPQPLGFSRKCELLSRLGGPCWACPSCRRYELDGEAENESLPSSAYRSHSVSDDELEATGADAFEPCELPLSVQRLLGMNVP